MSLITSKEKGQEDVSFFPQEKRLLLHAEYRSCNPARHQYGRASISHEHERSGLRLYLRFYEGVENFVGGLVARLLLHQPLTLQLLLVVENGYEAVAVLRVCIAAILFALLYSLL